MTLIVLALAVAVGGAILSGILQEKSARHVVAVAGAISGLFTLLLGILAITGFLDFAATYAAFPGLGGLVVAVHPLQGVFLAGAGGVFLAVSIASAGYLPRYLGHFSLKAFGVWYLLLLAATITILVAGDLLTFFIAWELMSILSFLLVNFEHAESGRTRAAQAMLAAGEVGTLAALVGLLILAPSGSLSFGSIASHAHSLSAGLRWWVFLLTFFGFGVKAGILPGMGWLPRAHPAAPANASAILSGVILNLGIYGIVLSNGWLAGPPPLAAGLIVLGTGALTSVVGILYANTDNDLKRMLAHSSIENMGLVTAALGAAFTFLAVDQPALAAIAYIAALYHALNHGFYKSLLFLGAGAVDQAAGTRQMDALGGLARRMPWTAAFVLAGSLAIAAMPPFSGFASEWLIIQSILRSVDLSSPAVRVVFALSGVLVALTAGLAATAFVKAYAMTFLGIGRSETIDQATDAPVSLRFGMAILAGTSLLLGVLPATMVNALAAVARSLGAPGGSAALVPPFLAGGLPPAFSNTFALIGASIGKGLLPAPGLILMHRTGPGGTGVAFAMSTTYLVPMLAGLLLATYVGVKLFARRRLVRVRPWDGGRRVLWPEATYTATGFAAPVRSLFRSVFQRDVTQEEIRHGSFRLGIRREADEDHIIDSFFMRPIRELVVWMSRGLARMHQGRLDMYAAFAFFALVLALILIHA